MTKLSLEVGAWVLTITALVGPTVSASPETTGLSAVVADPGGEKAAAAAKRRRKPCPPARTRTLDAGVHGRVYVAASSNQRDGEQDPVRLCSYRTKRHRFLGYDDCFNALQPGITRFAGRLLGVGYTECTPGGTFALIRVLRVRSGSIARSLDPAPDVKPLAGGGPLLTSVNMLDLVMRANGALAWIVEVANPMSGPSGYQVRSSARGKASIVLAAGASIERGSLALAASRIYWTQDGQPRSARVP